MPLAFTAGERRAVRTATRTTATIALSKAYQRGIHAIGDSFVLFCEAMGETVAFNTFNIADWMVDYCREGYSARSLSGRLTALRRFARMRGKSLPPADSDAWKDIIDLRHALLKIDPTSPSRATPVTVAELRAVATYLGLRTLDDLYDPAKCQPWKLALYTRAVVAHCPAFAS